MNDRIARAALTRLFEPGDRVGQALIGRLGAYAALRLATGAQPAHTLPDVTRGVGRRVEALGSTGSGCRPGKGPGHDRTFGRRVPDPRR